MEGSYSMLSASFGDDRVVQQPIRVTPTHMWKGSEAYSNLVYCKVHIEGPNLKVASMPLLSPESQKPSVTYSQADIDLVLKGLQAAKTLLGEVNAVKARTKLAATIDPEPNMVVPDNIVPDNIVPDNIVPDNIAPNMVVPEKVVPNMVVPEKVAPNMVVPKKVAPNMVVPKKVAPNMVVPKTVAPNMVVPKKVASNMVVPEKVASNMVVPEKVASNQPSAPSNLVNKLASDNEKRLHDPAFPSLNELFPADANAKDTQEETLEIFQKLTKKSRAVCFYHIEIANWNLTKAYKNFQKMSDYESDDMVFIRLFLPDGEILRLLFGSFLPIANLYSKISLELLKQGVTRSFVLKYEESEWSDALKNMPLSNFVTDIRRPLEISLVFL